MEGPPKAVAVDVQEIRSNSQETVFAAVGGP